MRAIFAPQAGARYLFIIERILYRNHASSGGDQSGPNHHPRGK